MSDSAHNPDDYCYRHPDRLSFVLCERCGRTICLECQNHVDGRVLCPDDAQARVTQISEAREAHARADRRTRARTRTRVPLVDRIKPGIPLVSYALGSILILVFLVDAVSGGRVYPWLIYFPGFATMRPWTLVTSMFAEGGGSDGVLGLLFNLLIIWFVGRRFEENVGRLRFAALYVVSGLGASVFAYLFNGVVLDAGSALFGLIGAAVIVLRRYGGQLLWIYISLGLSVLQIVLSSSRAILWQAAVGGLLTGAVIAFTYLYEGTPQKVRRQRTLVIAIAALLVVLAIVKTIAFPL